MANAASQQALEVGKERLREFLEQSEGGKQAMEMSGREGAIRESIGMDRLDSGGKRREKANESDDDDL